MAKAFPQLSSPFSIGKLTILLGPQQQDARSHLRGHRDQAERHMWESVAVWPSS